MINWKNKTTERNKHSWFSFLFSKNLKLKKLGDPPLIWVVGNYCKCFYTNNTVCSTYCKCLLVYYLINIYFKFNCLLHRTNGKQQVQKRVVNCLACQDLQILQSHRQQIIITSQIITMKVWMHLMTAMKNLRTTKLITSLEVVVWLHKEVCVFNI